VAEHGYDDPRITAVGLFAEAYTGLAARLAAQVTEHGLALIEFEVLMRLARSPQRQLRMSDLAAQTQLTTSGITRVVDRLERGGFVRRSACATDRRSWYTVITDAGLCRLADVLPGHLEVLDRWFTGLLPPDQLDSTLAALRTIRDAVRPNAAVVTPHS
jgi:MarR family transcriptional regulator, 2-MHQ and catechol-resistance regulon repressor